MPTLLTLFLLRRVRDSLKILLYVIQNTQNLTIEERDRIVKHQQITGYVNGFITIAAVLTHIALIVLFAICGAVIVGYNPFLLVYSKCLETFMVIVGVWGVNHMLASDRGLMEEENALHAEIDELAAELEKY